MGVSAILRCEAARQTLSPFFFLFFFFLLQIVNKKTTAGGETGRRRRGCRGARRNGGGRRSVRVCRGLSVGCGARGAVVCLLINKDEEKKNFLCIFVDRHLDNCKHQMLVLPHIRSFLR